MRTLAWSEAVSVVSDDSPSIVAIPRCGISSGAAANSGEDMERAKVVKRSECVGGGLRLSR